MIRSITHRSCNEDGVGQLEIRRQTTFVQDVITAWKTRSFSSPGTVNEIYVVRGVHWVDKVTGKLPNQRKQNELSMATEEIKRRARDMDAGVKF